MRGILQVASLKEKFKECYLNNICMYKEDGKTILIGGIVLLRAQGTKKKGRPVQTLKVHVCVMSQESRFCIVPLF